jgi:hypothetical protein
LKTDGNDAAVTVKIARLADHSTASDPIGQRKTPSLPATPAFAIGPHAELAAFGGVDAKEADALTVNLNGVAVDNGSDADDGILRDPTRYHRESKHETNGKPRQRQCHALSHRWRQC